MYRILMAVLILSMVSTSALAREKRMAHGLKVTKVQVYHRLDNSVRVWLHFNGSSRIGPNPDNPSVTCEAWTQYNGPYIPYH